MKNARPKNFRELEAKMSSAARARSDKLHAKMAKELPPDEREARRLPAASAGSGGNGSRTGRRPRSRASHR